MGLPTELWDNVIDHIHDHKPTLLACARVCHAWLNSARYHLFHTMELTLREPKPRLLALAAFSKSHPEIAACIRTLRVQPALGLTSNPVEIQVLIVVVSVLPNLRTIALSQMQLDHSRKHDPTLPDITLEDAASTSVQSLSIRTVAQTRSLVDILRDLCLFPSLNTLELSFISWPDNEVDFCLLVPPIPLRLKTFTVGMMTDPSQLFRYIRTTPSVHTLTSLCLFGLRIPDVESAGLLIQDIGSSLLHFALSMEHFRSPAGWAGNFIPQLNLAKCTSLQSIRLVVPHYSQRHASFFNQGTCLPGWKYTHELLSHVAPTLRRISLVARLEHHSGGLGALIEEWNTMDWDGIVESLKSFPDLERVEFVQQDVVPPSPTPRVTPLNDDLQTILLSRLPRLLDLGVLHFQPE